jgi:hypothetical protein
VLPAGANVTLGGIHHLCETIMMVSHELKTPMMSIPLNAAISEKEALKLTHLSEASNTE